MMIKSILLAFLVSCTVVSNPENVKSVAPQGFSDAIKNDNNYIIVDVRTPQEYNHGYIKGAKNIDYNKNNFNSKMEEIDKNKTLYIYCASNNRRGKANRQIQNLKFSNIIELKGGFYAWGSSKFPVVKQTRY